MSGTSFSALEYFNGMRYLLLFFFIFTLLTTCRLFEEGGNFCAAEVTEYIKRLEKTTQQLTATEQTLSAELKTVEPKKTEQIAKVIRDFEERS